MLAARYVNALLAAQSNKGKDLKNDQESLAQFAKVYIYKLYKLSLL